LEAAAENLLPSNQPEADSAEPVLVENGKLSTLSCDIFIFFRAPEDDFIPYHPSVDGQLTMALLKEIADRKCYRAMRFTTLIIAAYVGNEQLVKKLLRKGMDPKKKDINERSAIWWAQGMGS